MNLTSEEKEIGAIALVVVAACAFPLYQAYTVDVLKEECNTLPEGSDAWRKTSNLLLRQGESGCLHPLAVSAAPQQNYSKPQQSSGSYGSDTAYASLENN